MFVDKDIIEGISLFFAKGKKCLMKIVQIRK